MDQIVVTGMVISTSPVGEYDRRVTLLTRELGKISAFAKGSRKPNSHLIGAVNPFSFGEFTIYVGRNSYTIQSASISNYFEGLREDIVGAYYGFYFLEIADYFGKEGNDESQILLLLYQSLRALLNDRIPDPLIRRIYELKCLTINGEGPQVYECVSCGDKDRPAVFSANKGGLICTECAGNVIDGIHLSSSALYTMQFIESAAIEKLYTFLVKPQVQSELDRVMDRYMEVYVSHHFKSLEILKTLL